MTAYSIFDTKNPPIAIPVLVDRGDHQEHQLGVMLRYVTPRAVLESHFVEAVRNKEDPFPRENFQGGHQDRYVVSETHTLETLNRLMKSGEHPQQSYLATAKAVLEIAERRVKNGLPPVDQKARELALA